MMSTHFPCSQCCKRLAKQEHLLDMRDSFVCSYRCFAAAVEDAVRHPETNQTISAYFVDIPFGESFSAILSQLPDRFLVTGKLDTQKMPLTLLVGPQNLPIKIPAELELLESYCQQASFGKGNETLVDTTVRKVQETDRCQVKIDLDPIMDSIARELGLASKPIPSFYKVLYYKKKDFFLEHYDTKRSPNHLLTLAVDLGSQCVGGTLVFPTAARNSAATWDSNGGTGSWACWYATQRHAVEKLRSGYRVIAVYNLDVDPAKEGLLIADASSLSRNVLIEKSTTAESKKSLLTLPSDVLRLIFDRLVLPESKLKQSVRDVLHLSQTCKSLHTALTISWTLATWLVTMKPYLKRVMTAKYELSTHFQRNRYRKLGVPLLHRYSFDGKRSLSVAALRGRDRTVAEAFLMSRLGTVTVVPCVLRAEKAQKNYGNECSVADVQVYQAVTETQWKNWDDDLDRDEEGELSERTRMMRSFTDFEQSLLPPDAVKEKALEWWSLRSLLHRTETECDIFDLPSFWPFWDVIWLADDSYLRSLYNNEALSESRTSLYGNGASFDLYWYESAVILLDIAAVFEVREEQATSN